MKVFFRDRNPEFIQSVSGILGFDQYNVDFQIPIVGNPLEMEVDAVVSPGNSFGFMDGGFDFYVTQRFGPGVQERLQAWLKLHNPQELLVGQAVAIPTRDEKIPWCICAPTMRVPYLLTSSEPAFLASRAAVIEALKFRMESIAFTGMGTGVGNLHPNAAALAMVRGIVAGFYPDSFPQTLMEAAVNASYLRKY